MEENGGSLTDGEQRDVSRSALGVDRKHKIQKVLERGRGKKEGLSDQKKPPAEGGFSRDAKVDILDLRPTSQQGKRWDLGDRKDQR